MRGAWLFALVVGSLNVFAAPNLTPSLKSSSQNSDPVVRVRMQVAQSQILLSGFFKNSEMRRGKYLSVSVTRDGSAWVTRVLGDAKKQMRTRSESPTLTYEGQDMSIHDLQLPPKVVLVPNRKSATFDVIAPVSMESYLLGVLPEEMPKSWPLEALKAQAVASRTYVYKRMRERSRMQFDVENSVHDQVFRWLPVLGGKSDVGNDRVRQAILETRGQILLDDHDRVYSTFFHSQCGGQTENSKSVWGISGVSSVKDKYCILASKRWQYSVPKAKLSEMVRVALNLTDPGEMMRFGIGKRTASGRADFFIAEFANGERHRIRGDQLRSILGYDKLKSTQLELVSEANDWAFTGKGFGHGVGLCQWGARAMAEDQKSHKEILAHYYLGSRLQDISNLPL